MNISLNKGTLEKACVVWLILSSGSVFYSKVNMFLCMAIMVFLSLLLLFVFNKGEMGRNNLLTAGMVLGYGFLTCLINGMNGFSVNDFLIFGGSLFFLATITSYITAKQFQQTFINTIYVISVISLICFAFVMLFPNVKLPFEMSIAQVNWRGTFYYTLGFYGGRFTRNAGVFGEGGVFQIFLNLALFYLVQSEEPIKHKNRKMIVLIVALLTTVSSMGYVVMVLVLISMMLKNNISKKRYFILATLCIVAIILVDASTGLLSDKIMNQNGSFGSRYDDTIVSIETANEKPLFGYGISNDLQEAWEAHLNSESRITNPNYVTLQRSSGIGLVLMRCGYPFLIIYVIAMYFYFKKTINRSMAIHIIGTLILVLGIINEPIQFTPIFLLSFFRWRVEDKGKEIRDV